MVRVQKRLRSPVQSESSENGTSDSEEEADWSDNRKRLKVSTPDGPRHISAGHAGFVSSSGSQHSESQQLSDQSSISATANIAGPDDEKAANAPNVPAENGIIEAVICHDFMCHSKLEVRLGPLINFIIGHNGSGKSAVLTALTICLGGKASATNRGHNLKSFIKEGRESATVIVKLKNTGSTGFQPETYGNTITVERSFSKSGSSSFKIRNAAGRIVSTRRSDLEEITDYFTLQLENPMNVLSQDSARQFLSNSTGAEKYRFFIKGVQLEQLDHDYILLADSIRQIAAKLRDREEDLSVLKRNQENTENKVRAARKQDTLRQQINSLENMLVWAQVEEQEKLLIDFIESVESLDGDVEKMRDAAELQASAFNEVHAQSEDIDSKVRDAQNLLEPIEDQKERVSELFKTKTEELRSFQAEQRSISEAIKSAENRISAAKKNILDEQKRIEETDGGGHAARLQCIEDSKEALEDSKKRLKKQEEELRFSRARESQARTRCGEAKGLKESKYNEVQAAEKQLEILEKHRASEFDAFSARMPQLLSAIRQDRSFRSPPVGPIGRHIRLLKPLWSSVLEKSFGAALNAFVVTTKADEARLSSHMRKVGCICTIFIGNRQHIDTSNGEPDRRFDTTLRVLEIDDDMVRSQLIINQAIDQVILIENRREAEKCMYDAGRLKNVKNCLCINATKHGWGVRLGYNRTGDASSSPISPFIGSPRMKTDSAERISSHKLRIQKMTEELQALKQDYFQAQNEVRECEKQSKACEMEITGLKIEVQQHEDKVHELQDEHDSHAVQDGHLEILKKELEDAEKEYAQHKAAYVEFITHKDELTKVSKETLKELKGLDKKLESMKSELGKLEGTALDLKEKRQEALRSKNVLLEEVQKLVNDRNLQDGERKRQQTIVEGVKSQALRICEKLSPGQTRSVLEQKILKLTADLHRFTSELGADAVELERAAAEAEEAYLKAKDYVNELDRGCAVLTSALRNRRQRWKLFRKSITARAKNQFCYLLSERGFRGNIRLDHEKRVLDLNVEPDETREGKGRATKTLSGGEKSFSTICLLLALWEAMGSPIRCLDEFDVFMDNVNRDVSMRMMIGAARRSIGRQYVLITPQSMNSIDAMNDVKIIRMGDPERGQTHLPY